MAGSASVRCLERAVAIGEQARVHSPLERAKRVDAQAILTVVTSRSGTVRESSPDVAALLRVGRMEGKLLIAFVARRDTRAFRAWLHALGRPASPRSLCLQLRPRGCQPFRALLSAVDVLDAEGAVVGLRWTIRRVEGEEKAGSPEPVEEPIEAAPESSARLSDRAMKAASCADVA